MKLHSVYHPSGHIYLVSEDEAIVATVSVPSSPDRALAWADEIVEAVNNQDRWTVADESKERLASAKIAAGMFLAAALDGDHRYILLIKDARTGETAGLTNCDPEEIAVWFDAMGEKLYRGEEPFGLEKRV